MWGLEKLSKSETAEVFEEHAEKMARDERSRLITYYENGVEAGKQKGVREAALKMLAENIDIHTINTITIYSIENLKKDKQQGITQNKQEALKQVALQMLDENMYISMITKITGLSKTEINKLKKTDTLEETAWGLEKLSKSETAEVFEEHAEKMARDEHSRVITFYEKGREQGTFEGRELGFAEGIKKTALLMLSENMDISMISKITNLSEAEINELKK